MGLVTPKSYLAIIIAVAFLFTVLQMQISNLKHSTRGDNQPTGSLRLSAENSLYRQNDVQFHQPTEEPSADKNGRRFRGRHKGAETSEDDKLLILYNRVPKTGSTSFMSILYKLYKPNNFNVLYVNVSTKAHSLSLPDQILFSRNITTWAERMPSVYHGHLPFVNFRKLGIAKQPIYINILRDPIERLVSYYYFLRYGDVFRPYLKRARQGDKTTFDECVQQRGRDCQPEKLWLQIPFFCGHLPQCWEPGSKWALQQAKQHLIDQYFLVGTTEKLEQFVRLLEMTIPRIFKGATEEYIRGGGVHLRKTKKKSPLLPQTIEKIKKSRAWQLENEFYQFAAKIFEDTYKRAVVKKGNITKPNKGRFFYQKVKPEFVKRDEDGKR